MCEQLCAVTDGGQLGLFALEPSRSCAGWPSRQAVVQVGVVSEGVGSTPPEAEATKPKRLALLLNSTTLDPAAQVLSARGRPAAARADGVLQRGRLRAGRGSAVRHRGHAGHPLPQDGPRVRDASPDRRRVRQCGGAAGGEADEHDRHDGLGAARGDCALRGPDGVRGGGRHAVAQGAAEEVPSAVQEPPVCADASRAPRARPRHAADAPGAGGAQRRGASCLFLRCVHVCGCVGVWGGELCWRRE